MNRAFCSTIFVALLAGCASPAATSDGLEEASLPCAGLCLSAALAVELQGCKSVGISLSIMEDTYQFPPGYEAVRPGPGNTHYGASQLAILTMWDCRETVIGGQALGPTTFGQVAILIEGPEVASVDFNTFVLEQVATGPLLNALRMRGFPAFEGAAVVERVATGSTGRFEENVTLQADVVHAPMMAGSGLVFSYAHHTAGGWYKSEAECEAIAGGTSVAVVRPGTSILRQAAGEGGVLRGSDTQDDECTLDLDFQAVNRPA